MSIVNILTPTGNGWDFLFMGGMPKLAGCTFYYGNYVSLYPLLMVELHWEIMMVLEFIIYEFIRQ